MCRGILEQENTKVRVDLSQVNRIDRAGLGMLMHTYSHIIGNRGMLKLVNLSPQVQRVPSIARIDFVIEANLGQDEATRFPSILFNFSQID